MVTAPSPSVSAAAPTTGGRNRVARFLLKLPPLPPPRGSTQQDGGATVWPLGDVPRVTATAKKYKAHAVVSYTTEEVTIFLERELRAFPHCIVCPVRPRHCTGGTAHGSLRMSRVCMLMCAHGCAWVHAIECMLGVCVSAPESLLICLRASYRTLVSVYRRSFACAIVPLGTCLRAFSLVFLCLLVREQCAKKILVGACARACVYAIERGTKTQK